MAGTGKAAALPISLMPSDVVRRVFKFCLGAELFICLCDATLNHLRWIPYRPLRKVFNITREDSISNWFSSTQSLFVGIVLLIIFLLERRDKVDKSSSRGWAILAAFFGYIAIDDASKFHERMGSSFKLMVQDSPFGISLFEFFPSYSWQIVFGPFFLVMGCYIAYFLWKQLKLPAERWTVFAALSCFVFAVFLDFLEGADIPSLSAHRIRHFMKLIEEFFEMLGNTLFLITFLKVLMQRHPRLSLEFKK